jgi:indole-3-glycerol phosphate synthase
VTGGAAGVLGRILQDKAAEVARAKAAVPLAQIRAQAEGAPGVRDFAGALRAKIDRGAPGVIAEIKKASPSKGLLRQHFDVEAIAQSYSRHGAACLSVLTDEKYFQGSPADLVCARRASGLPVLRKDFIVDPYQIFEARAMGADCILLIVAALEAARLDDFEALARELNLAVLVEVHERRELDLALELSTPLIGINNRNLHTFETALDVTLGLRGLVPRERLIITESGISTAEDVKRMRGNGIHAFLVGEAFMRAPDPGIELERIFITN